MADSDARDVRTVQGRHSLRSEDAAGPDLAVRRMVMHASAVEYGGRAALMVGASGSGKSGLALELLSRGATLVSDDGTLVERRGDRIDLSAPNAVAEKIEARHVGILKADSVRTAELAVVVDLSRPEPERLPPRRTTTVLGAEVELLFGAGVPNFAAALIQYLKAGRAD